jgi:hypothetical protein
MKEYGEFPIEERIKQDGIILSLKVNYYPLGRSLRKRGRFLCASDTFSRYCEGIVAGLSVK